MTQNDSGNRWEPEAGPTDATPTTGRPGIRERARALGGNRTAVVGGVVAAVLAVGAAGFGAGWAASPDDEGPGRFGGPDDHHRFPTSFPGDDDGDGRLPPGQPTAPDSESFSQSSWYVVPSRT